MEEFHVAHSVLLRDGMMAIASAINNLAGVPQEKKAPPEPQLPARPVCKEAVEKMRKDMESGAKLADDEGAPNWEKVGSLCSGNRYYRCVVDIEGAALAGDVVLAAPDDPPPWRDPAPWVLSTRASLTRKPHDKWELCGTRGVATCYQRIDFLEGLWVAGQFGMQLVCFATEKDEPHTFCVKTVK
jgi:hypothetical protein